MHVKNTKEPFTTFTDMIQTHIFSKRKYLAAFFILFFRLNLLQEVINFNKEKTLKK